MNVIQRVLQYFEDPTIPVSGKVFKDNTIEFQSELKYDYATIEKLVSDERIYSIIAMVASMVQKAYIGPEIRPLSRYTDDVLDPKEEELMAFATTLETKLNFKQLTFDYAWQLVTHGDLFEEITKSGEGIDALSSLPLNSIRVLEKSDQVNKSGGETQILKEEMVIVSTSENDTAPRTINKEDYIHLSFKNHAVWRKDIKQVDTYNIYSIPPIATLQRLVDWKKKTIENDIIWKNKLLPRLLHKLKMPSIVPSKYTGTPEEKIAKATADADRLTTNFTQSIRTLRPDDDITISDAVDTTMLEAKSTNYQKPNETLAQINSLLNTPQGIPSGLLGGDAGSSLATELSVIMAGIRVEYIVNKIADGLTSVMKRHLRIVAGESDEETIDRMYIHTDSALSLEKFQKMQTALAMVSTGEFTKAEVRKAAGYPRLPQLPAGTLANTPIKDDNSSLEAQAADIKGGKPGSENTNDDTRAKRKAAGEKTPDSA